MTNDIKITLKDNAIEVKLESFEYEIFRVECLGRVLFYIYGMDNYEKFAKKVYAAYKKYKYVFEKGVK